MPVRGGIAHPREEEHEDEDVHAHPACVVGRRAKADREPQGIM